MNYENLLICLKQGSSVITQKYLAVAGQIKKKFCGLQLQFKLQHDFFLHFLTNPSIINVYFKTYHLAGKVYKFAWRVAVLTFACHILYEVKTCFRTVHLAFASTSLPYLKPTPSSNLKHALFKKLNRNCLSNNNLFVIIKV